MGLNEFILDAAALTGFAQVSYADRRSRPVSRQPNGGRKVDPASAPTICKEKC